MAKSNGANQQIIDTILSSSEALNFGQLDEEAIPRLAQLLKASTTAFFRFDEQGRLYPIGGSLRNDIPQYTAHFLSKDPIWEIIVKADPRLAVFCPVQNMGARRFRQSDAYHEHYRFYEMDDLCLLRFTSPPFGTPGTAGVLLGRSSRQSNFSQQDIDLAYRLLPAFASAVRRIERFEVLENEWLGLEALIQKTATQPCLALGADGRLLWISGPARFLLGPNFDPKKHMPEKLVTAAKNLGQAALKKVALDSAAPTTEHTLTLHDGRTAQAGLSVCRTSNGSPVVLAFFLSDIKGGENHCEVVNSWGLSPAEKRVLEFLVLGLTNASIAQRLYVSIETVRTHVKHILDKLQAHTRTEAAFLANKYLPLASSAR
ncbi:MAG TPA: helix-turn-helix transcriptional regulator [bacterium]|nr:helix-turn-helix transcriptional regulator [bacterium]